MNANRSHRHFSHVFTKGEYVCDLPEEAISNLESVLAYYRDEKVNNVLRSMRKGKPDKHTGYLNYHIPSEGQFMPVYFQIVDQHIYLSPSQIGREVYYNTLHSIAKRQYSHDPCSEDHLCPSCRLFGIVNGKVKYGSRVRFCDARPISKDDYVLSNDFVMLKELATPKISSTEFYTYRPDKNARIWNYDYLSFDQNHPVSNQMIKLRGRKFYFHHPDVPETDYKANIPNEQNCSVRLLEKGILDFDVFVEHLTDYELKSLIWSLSPTDGTDNLYYHKLGFGKPLGLGSVEVKITSIEQRIFAKSKSNGFMEYQMVPIYDTQHPFSFYTTSDLIEAFNNANDESNYSITLTALLKILNYNCIDRNQSISYPVAQRGTGLNSTASHQWFAGNKQLSQDSSGVNEKVFMTLPLLEGSSLRLPKLTFDQNDNHAINVPRTVIKKAFSFINIASLNIDDRGQRALSDLNEPSNLNARNQTQLAEDTSGLIGHRSSVPLQTHPETATKVATLTIGQTYQGKIKSPARVRNYWIVSVPQGECMIKINGRLPEVNKSFKFKVVKIENSLLGTTYICQPS